MGTWMIDNLKELPADFITHPENIDGEHGYYYNYTSSRNACPVGWKLPEAQNAFDVLSLSENAYGTLLSELPIEGAVGYYNANLDPRPANVFWTWLQDGYIGNDLNYGTMTRTSYNISGWGGFTIRCVKEN
jgi:hypothetical protein